MAATRRSSARAAVIVAAPYESSAEPPSSLLPQPDQAGPRLGRARGGHVDRRAQHLGPGAQRGQAQPLRRDRRGPGQLGRGKELAAPLEHAGRLDVGRQRPDLVATRAPAGGQLEQELARAGQIAARRAHQRADRGRLVGGAARVGVDGGPLGLLDRRLRLARPPLGQQAARAGRLDARGQRRIRARRLDGAAQRGARRRLAPGVRLEQRQGQVQAGPRLVAQAGAERRVDELARPVGRPAGSSIWASAAAARARRSASPSACTSGSSSARAAGSSPARKQSSARSTGSCRTAERDGGRHLAAARERPRRQPGQRRHRRGRLIAAQEVDEAEHLAAGRAGHARRRRARAGSPRPPPRRRPRPGGGPPGEAG